MKLVTNLTLAQASTIVDSALAEARKLKLNPMTIVVLDAGGHMIAMKREDGNGILRVEIATGKAWGALGMGFSSRVLRDRMANSLQFCSALTDASQGRFVPVPGGVLICNAEGYVVGSAGMSGDLSEKDEYCVIQGIRAAGLTPDPAEPDPKLTL